MVPLPSADVTLVDDGFAGPVDRQGHGLQRAFILTLLQHLARVSGENIAAAPAGDDDVDGLNEDEALLREVARQVPSLILGIEEPELYQHPTKQRHFAKVLELLSDGQLPGAAGNTQVVFCSHSPLFASMHKFQQIRLARRVPLEGSEIKQCELRESNLQEVAHRLEHAFERPAGTFTDATLLPRLHILGAELAEGFFASCNVIVEGPSDKAALIATASLLGGELEANGIAILPAGGKTNLDRPAAIFSSLGIPTFVMWDCDNGDGAVQNRALPRLFENDAAYGQHPETVVRPFWASFERKLEATLHNELGGAALEMAHLEACVEYGMTPGGDAMKSPAVMTRTLEIAADSGARCATLEAIVRAIFALRGVELEPQ